MHIVDLTDAGISGEQHLAEHCAREGQVVVRRQPGSHVVHLLTPLPEITCSPVGASAQRAMERVAVRIGEPWHGEALEALTRCVPLDIALDPLDQTIDDRDQHPKRGLNW